MYRCAKRALENPDLLWKSNSHGWGVQWEARHCQTGREGTPVRFRGMKTASDGSLLEVVSRDSPQKKKGSNERHHEKI